MVYPLKISARWILRMICNVGKLNPYQAEVACITLAFSCNLGLFILTGGTCLQGLVTCMMMIIIEFWSQKGFVVRSPFIVGVNRSDL